MIGFASSQGGIHLTPKFFERVFCAGTEFGDFRILVRELGLAVSDLARLLLGVVIAQLPALGGAWPGIVVFGGGRTLHGECHDGRSRSGGMSYRSVEMPSAPAGGGRWMRSRR